MAMPEQRKTNRFRHATPTSPLPGGDLGLLATAVVLRGRRLLEQRSPRTLKGMQRLAALPLLRKAVLGTLNGIERVGLAGAVLRTRLLDAMTFFSHRLVGRARHALGNLLASLTGKRARR